MIWAAPYSNIGGDYPTDLVVDGSGNVYVTGGSCSSIDPNSNGAGYPGCVDYDWATVKYSPEGLQQWVARYSETSLPGYWDEPTAIGIDSPGNVYVAGYAGMEENFTLIKYDPSGNQTWVGSFGPGAPTSLVVDVMGNVYVTGESCRDADCSALDYLTLKHTPNNTVNNTPPTITALVALTNQLFTSGAIDNMGIANSLRLKLSNALAAKNNGNTQSSNNMLNAFINQVTAQSGKHISAVAAATLVNAATSIVNH
jgi:hypothetical protein